MPRRVGRFALPALFPALLAAFALLAVFARPVTADPSYPAFTAPVVDAAHVLSDADQAAITQQVLDLQKKSNIQFAVATVPSLGGDEIEPYANALFRQWKIGQKNVSNGLLLVVAPKEHKLRFEVGYGLEGVMTDLQSKLIIANTMVPKLKAGDTAGAIKAGVADAIIVLTTDKASWPQHLKPATDDGGGGGLVLMVFFVIIFIVVVMFVLAYRRRRGGGSGWGPWTTGTGIGAASDSFTDSGSSSSGGDSFSGGGGGDSGGGGASGSW